MFSLESMINRSSTLTVLEVTGIMVSVWIITDIEHV